MKTIYQLLCVDHDSETLNRFSAAFGSQYQVYLAARVDVALKIMSENEIDLLVADFNLTEMDGLEFLEALIPRYPEMVKILTVGSDNLEIYARAIHTKGITGCVPVPWTENHLKATIDHALKMYSQQLASRDLISDLQKMLRDMDFIREVSLKISETKPLPQLLAEIIEGSKIVMNAEASSLLLYNQDDDKLYFQIVSGDHGHEIKQYSVDVGVGIAGWVAKFKKSLLIEDCYKDPRFNPEYDKKIDFRTRSMVCAPLVRKGNLLGVVQVMNKKDGGKFTENDLLIFDTLASQCAIAIENARLVEQQIEREALERELETAREIQQKLLPATLPTFDDLDVASKLIPTKQVGGDYYDVITIDDDKTLFVVADATGKGIPAALLVSTFHSCLQTLVNLENCSITLLTLVANMSRVLLQSTPPEQFVTAWFGLYHHSDKSLSSINAGHNPPYIFRRGQIEPLELQTGGLFLGMMDLPYDSEEIVMQPGDVLVFFTDGVTEAWNDQEEDYEESRLIDTARQHLNKPAIDILTAIEHDVNNHVGLAPQSDDFTCGVVKVR